MASVVKCFLVLLRVKWALWKALWWPRGISLHSVHLKAHSSIFPLAKRSVTQNRTLPIPNVVVKPWAWVSHILSGNTMSFSKAPLSTRVHGILPWEAVVESHRPGAAPAPLGEPWLTAVVLAILTSSNHGKPRQIYQVQGERGTPELPRPTRQPQAKMERWFDSSFNEDSSWALRRQN